MSGQWSVHSAWICKFGVHSSKISAQILCQMLANTHTYLCVSMQVTNLSQCWLSLAYLPFSYCVERYDYWQQNEKSKSTLSVILYHSWWTVTVVRCVVAVSDIICCEQMTTIFQLFRWTQTSSEIDLHYDIFRFVVSRIIVILALRYQGMETYFTLLTLNFGNHWLSLGFFVQRPVI